MAGYASQPHSGYDYQPHYPNTSQQPPPPPSTYANNIAPGALAPHPQHQHQRTSSHGSMSLQPYQHQRTTSNASLQPYQQSQYPVSQPQYERRPSHHSHHSHQSHHSRHSYDRYDDRPSRTDTEDEELERRPTFGDTIAMMLKTVFGLLPGKTR